MYSRCVHSAHTLCFAPQLDVPLGVSVEAVSKSAKEQVAALQLFTTLRDQLQRHYDGDAHDTLHRTLHEHGTYIVQSQPGAASITKVTPAGPELVGAFTYRKNNGLGERESAGEEAQEVERKQTETAA